MKNGAGDETYSTSRNREMFELTSPKTAVISLE
jgi:hypothetical protein